MKHFNYPPQTGEYVVKVKNGAGWRAYDTCRLQISVGKERHEGAKFEATVDWCRHRFARVIVCVNDTLQRFNDRAYGADPAAAYQKALQAGDGWLLRNGRLLEGCAVHRWDEWLARPGFAPLHKDIRDYYAARADFREAVAEARKNDLSPEYLLEEIAVFLLMDREGATVDVYPGTLPRAIAMMRDTHTTRIDFSRRDNAAGIMIANDRAGQRKNACG